MAKNLKGAGSASINTLDTIAMGNTNNTPNTTDTENTSNTLNTKKKETTYRFNLIMPLSYKAYLQKAAYEASSPEKTVSITEYICDLIKADIEKNS